VVTIYDVAAHGVQKIRGSAVARTSCAQPRRFFQR